jgi:hypothetical protein
MKNKHIRLIVIIYCAVLIAGTVIYYILPKDNFTKVNTNDGNSNSSYFDPAPKAVVQELKNKDLIGKYKVGSYNFDKETLEISSNIMQEQVIIERKSTNDRTIEVYRIAGSEKFWREELSKKVSSPKIELVDYKLNIIGAEQKLDYIQFEKDPIVTQFKQNEINNDDGFGRLFITDIIYVKVPKDQKVIVNGMYDYINQ